MDGGKLDDDKTSNGLTAADVCPWRQFLSPSIVRRVFRPYDESAFSQKRRPADCLLLAAISFAPPYHDFRWRVLGL